MKWMPTNHHVRLWFRSSNVHFATRMHTNTHRHICFIKYSGFRVIHTMYLYMYYMCRFLWCCVKVLQSQDFLAASRLPLFLYGFAETLFWEKQQHKHFHKIHNIQHIYNIYSIIFETKAQVLLFQFLTSFENTSWSLDRVKIHDNWNTFHIIVFSFSCEVFWRYRGLLWQYRKNTLSLTRWKYFVEKFWSSVTYKQSEDGYTSIYLHGITEFIVATPYIVPPITFLIQLRKENVLY